MQSSACACVCVYVRVCIFRHILIQPRSPYIRTYMFPMRLCGYTIRRYMQALLTIQKFICTRAFVFRVVHPRKVDRASWKINDDEQQRHQQEQNKREYK